MSKLITIKDWYEKKAEEAISVAENLGLKYADAVERIGSALHIKQKVKIMDRVIEISLAHGQSTKQRKMS